MALLFSQVTVTAGNDAVSFLVGGIPREYDDLEDWDEFDDFLKYIDEETEVLVHADAYLYGEGEPSEASYSDIQQFFSRLKSGSSFLTDYRNENRYASLYIKAQAVFQVGDFFS